MHIQVYFIYIFIYLHNHIYIWSILIPHCFAVCELCVPKRKMLIKFAELHHLKTLLTTEKNIFRRFWRCTGHPFPFMNVTVCTLPVIEGD